MKEVHSVVGGDFLGKNQRVNFMFAIWQDIQRYNQSDFTEKFAELTEIDDSLGNLKDIQKFSEFFIYIIENSSEDEIKELLFHNFINIFHSYISSVEEFDQIWSEITLKFTKSEISKILIAKNSNFDSILFLMNKNQINAEFLMKILKLLEDNLSKNEIFQLLKSNNFDNETPLLYALQNYDFELFKIIWDFTRTNLNKTQLKEVLAFEGTSLKLSILHFSMCKKDDNIFKYVRDIFGEIFNLDELKTSLAKKSQYFGTYLFRVIKKSSLKTSQEVARYLEDIFENEKHTLRNILMTTNVFHQTILTYKDGGDIGKTVDKNRRAFKELFDKITDSEDDNDDFDEYD